MKKRKCKQYLKLVMLLFGATFVLSSCQKDDVDYLDNQADLEKTSKYAIETLTHKQVQSNETVFKELQKLAPKLKNGSGNRLNREIYNSDYGFTINTDFVKYIEDTQNGNHSYSFPIKRDSVLSNNIENLLLHSNTENGYDAYIVQYDFTASEYTNLDEGIINSRNTILLPIDFDTSVFNNGELSKMVYGCVETWEWSDGVPHNGQVHGADCACNPSQGWVLTSISCGNYDDGASGGGNGIPTSPGTSDGGSGGDSSGTTYDNGFDPTDPNNHGNSGNLPILAAPAIVTQSQMLDLLLGNASYVFDNSLSDEETMNFSSISELQAFLNNFENSFINDEFQVENNPDGTKLTKFKGTFQNGLIFPVSINVHVTSVLENPLSIESEFQVLEVVSFDSGYTPFADWEQASYEYSSNGNVTTVNISGYFDFGIAIEGFDIVSFKEQWEVKVKYNNQTGVPNPPISVTKL
ncbi:hypothetical protein ES676_14265 [Bizionia saleffrena]|uniref:PKD domain-containing protein n=1 Tax=Bizionia saleffrena TaxID=291189 RepID=A0A8H2QDF9_9FLAO|nr:hypothetical protein [Bizionia saleffrena]TYB69072.1 hypothetical protein ES676_14265 [Bizionia saleffrena]